MAKSAAPAARAVGFTGFGFYQKNNFMHIDTGPAREWGVRWFKRTNVSAYTDTHRNMTQLPKEQPLQPETAREDKDLIGSVVGGGGGVAGGGAVLTGIGGLSPVVQGIAVVGLLVAAAALLYIFRNRLRNLAR